MTDYSQLSTWDQRAIPKPVKVDFNQVPQGVDGVTGSRPVQTADGIHYIAKNDGWNPDITGTTHVLLQEWICARLGERVGVPIPDYSLLELGEEICFGSRLLRVAYPRFVPSLIERVANPDDMYQIVVFDTWLANTDRHPGNLMVVHQGTDLRLVAIDHSHCPLFGTSPVRGLVDIRDFSARDTVKAYLRPLIKDRVKLAKAIESVQNLADNEVVDLLVTPACLQVNQSTLSSIREFLLYRKGRLRHTFNKSRDLFPAISEQAL